MLQRHIDVRTDVVMGRNRIEQAAGDLVRIGVEETNPAQAFDTGELFQEQREAILARNWGRMIEVGGNIYFLSKLFSTDGLSFQHVAATMTGLTQEQYAEMMLKGGRPIEGNRSKSEWQKRG